MTTTLCGQCSELNLSAACFMIENIGCGEQLVAHPRRVTHGRSSLGTMSRIKDTATTCQLCALIAHTVQDVVAKERLDDVTCDLYWEIDGRTPRASGRGRVENRTRRLRICWNDQRLKPYDAYLMLAAPARYNQSDIGYPGLLNPETQFLGRRIGSSLSKRNLIREFLRLCQEGHTRCRTRLDAMIPFSETLKGPYFGVIDIESEQLVPLPFREDASNLSFEWYATVSYVWGDNSTHSHSTRLGNIQSRLQSGGLTEVISTLPRALQQSINLVHGLGIRYFWIDSLCIVQDSSHSWDLNSRAMHLIYGNSTVTICAADGKDAREGLVALEQSPQQMIATVAEGANLILHQPSEASIEITQWNKRAWTFQERVLSRRCLIFTQGKIYFQCRSTSMSEDVFADEQEADGCWSLDLVRAPLQMLEQLKLRTLWFYTNSVCLYTQRELSEPFDILAAFSGMCKLMEDYMGAPFQFGLPTSHFDFALLWEPIGKSSRREYPRTPNDPKYKNMRFPSWSWSGWESKGVTYSRDMVEGCLADVRAWLLGRTWIDWHIRDGHGTLRRLWNVNYCEDKSLNSRWRGYKTNPRPRGKPSPAVGWDSRTGASSGESDKSSSASSSTRRTRRTRRDEPQVPHPPAFLNAPRAPPSYLPDPASFAPDPTFYPPWQRIVSRIPEDSPTRTKPRHLDESREPKHPAYYRNESRLPKYGRYRTNPNYLDESREPKHPAYYQNESQLPESKPISNRIPDRFGNRPPPPDTKQVAGGEPKIIFDNFGRRCSHMGNPGQVPDREPKFTLTLPEDPYNVRTTVRNGVTRASNTAREFPDQHFLQFFTWRTHFHIVRSTANQGHLSNGLGINGTHVVEPLSRCDILDSCGDKCGSISVDSEWLEKVGTRSRFEFIAISQAKCFTEQEFPDWTYYIPLERTESDWQLYFVVLVEHYPEEGIYRRVALGKVFQAAFTHSVPSEWKEIILG
ncbi:heterokaryon incompatibility protein-domain-containing protein [Xylariaceae sp. FL0804]|nr:heterokaryon incompatibility protein-domain-containing protein [Xylariaceae sp. FL0804]